MAKKQAKTEEIVAVGSKGKLGVLLGCSVISVMRAMGKHGWQLAEVQASLAAHVGKDGLALLPKEHTMKLALKRGRDEAKGIDTGRKVAPLSAKQLEALRVTPKAKKGKGKKKAEVVVEQAEPVHADEAAEEAQEQAA